MIKIQICNSYFYNKKYILCDLFFLLITLKKYYLIKIFSNIIHSLFDFIITKSFGSTPVILNIIFYFFTIPSGSYELIVLNDIITILDFIILRLRYHFFINLTILYKNLYKSVVKFYMLFYFKFKGTNNFYCFCIWNVIRNRYLLKKYITNEYFFFKQK